MNFNELVKLKQAFGPDLPEQAAYFYSKDPKPALDDLETGILNKYNAWNLNRTKNSASLLRRSEKDILLDDLVEADQAKERHLMEECPGLHSVDQAKFWLEAAGYNLNEAKQLFKDSQRPSGQVKVTLNLATGQQVVRFYPEHQEIWEISREVFRNSGKTFEFSVFIEELSQAFNEAQMKQKFFSELGVKTLTFVVLT